MAEIKVEFHGEPKHEDIIKTAIVAAYEYLSPGFSACVDVTFSDDEHIRQLNSQYRNVDKSTDVLSFPMEDFYRGKPDFDPAQHPETHIFLGDIVINMAQAMRQAEEYGHSLRRECAYLSVHSLLHLAGFDHEDEGAEKVEMRSAEKEIMNKINDCFEKGEKLGY